MKIERTDHRLFERQVRRWGFWQKLRNPFAGLRCLTRDSGGGLIIISRHWPHMLCWSWSVSWRWPDGGKSGTHHKWGFHRSIHNGGGWVVGGPLWLHWQTYSYVASGCHEDRLNKWLMRRGRRAA